MSELTFRAATEADVQFLLELRRQTMTEHLQRSGVEASESERIERVLANFDCAEIILGAPVRLSVLRANPARRLYERLGFRIVGENGHGYDMQYGGGSGG